MMALQKVRPSVLQQFVRTSTYMVYAFAPKNYYALMGEIFA